MHFPILVGQQCHLVNSSFLREEKVAIIPGVAFGEQDEGYVRISFTTPLEKIEQEVLRIKHLVEAAS